MDIKEAVWDLKYSPKNFNELIQDHKQTILNYLKKPSEIPSFLFVSNSPGTGKTTTAKLIAKHLGCDFFKINASKDRGIDMIRDEVRTYAEGMSIVNNLKRCILLDEADGLTKVAQESMKGIMDEYADNCFFILSCNDESKIIEPLRSRCVKIAFDFPNRRDIIDRLAEIAEAEKLKVSEEEINNLIEIRYPDIRSMILTLQEKKTGQRILLTETNEYTILYEEIKKKNLNAVYKAVFEDNIDMLAFNKYMRDQLFNNREKFSLTKLKDYAKLIADTEKNYNLGVNLKSVFLANVLELMSII